MLVLVLMLVVVAIDVSYFFISMAKTGRSEFLLTVHWLPLVTWKCRFQFHSGHVTLTSTPIHIQFLFLSFVFCPFCFPVTVFRSSFFVFRFPFVLLGFLPIVASCEKLFHKTLSDVWERIRTCGGERSEGRPPSTLPERPKRCQCTIFHKTENCRQIYYAITDNKLCKDSKHSFIKWSSDQQKLYNHLQTSL